MLDGLCGILALVCNDNVKKLFEDCCASQLYASVLLACVGCIFSHYSFKYF